MIKRGIVLLVGVALLLGAAPSAMAGHCWRCKFERETGTTICWPAAGFIPGREFCDDGPSCIVSGDECIAHGFAPEPLGAEWLVASVERLDDPQTAVNETLLADAQAAPPSAR